MMKKNTARIITIIFLCFAPVWMIFAKDRMFSDKENRNLARMPGITWKTLINGEFMDDFETYLADQFPVRDWCVSVRTASLRAVGKRLINDVYIAKEGYLIAKETEADENRLFDMNEALIHFAEKVDEDIKVSLMLVPNTSFIYEDLLPYGASSNQEDILEWTRSSLEGKVSLIDVTDIFMEKKSEGLYYKTDHHWTTRGAYYAFCRYSGAVNIEPVEYEFYPVTGGFQGTQASNSGVYSTYETVEICAPLDSVGTYLVKYVNENVTTTTFFSKDKLGGKDKYQVFMGGNYAQIDISTTSDTGRNLMIIKDSYANCFIPMLTPYYDKIIVIDPRYFYDDIYFITKINSINEVLFLYNINSYMEDNSLYDIIYDE